MSLYKSAITENADGEFYALIVRVNADGEKNVIHGYKGRYLKTRKAAERSINSYIDKHCLNS